jgi:hypothetical protein
MIPSSKVMVCENLTVLVYKKNCGQPNILAIEF